MFATLVTNFDNTKNKIFEKDLINDPDGYRSKYVELKKYFFKHGFDIATEDLNPIDSSKIVIYVDVPKKLVNLDAK